MNHYEFNKTNGCLYKLAAIIGFVMVLTAITIAWNEPATGYESSIYLSTPFVSWVLLAIGLVTGIAIVLFKTRTEDTIDKGWFIGLILIWSVNLVILSLPTIRSYYFWNGSGDTGQHLGFTQDLLTTGHIAKDIVYPITHILSAQISIVLGIEPITLFRWVMLLFAGLSFISIYLICKELLSNKRQVAISTLIGSILFSNWFTVFSPNTIGNMLFPFIIFLLVKIIIVRNHTLQWTICFITMVLLIVPLHPVPAFAFLLVIITIWLWYKVKPQTSYIYNDPNAVRAFGIPIVLLTIVWLIIWISSFGIWNTTLRNIYILVTEGSQQHIQTVVEQAAYAAQNGYNVLSQFIKVYGVTLVYVFLATCGFIILKWRTSKTYYSNLLIPIALAIILNALVMVTMYFSNLFFGPSRMEAYIIFLCTPFVGAALGWFIDTFNWPQRSGSIRVILVGLLLVLLSTGTFLKLYPSPYILSISYQNTKSEITGMDWFLHNKDFHIFSSGWYYAPGIFGSYLLTIEERSGRDDLSPYVTKAFPDRLGYDKYDELGQNYEEDIYLVMTELTRKVYVDLFPKMAYLRLTTDDLDRLEEDPSVDKLYTNKGIDIYYVYAN
jgi:hypothetical protein